MFPKKRTSTHRGSFDSIDTGNSNALAWAPGNRNFKQRFPYGRYKSIIGDRLRVRHPKSQEAEALIACNILNRMTELGRPGSFAIGA